ncbi:MAG: hypothetical protein WAT21_08220 [Saprospiraceae bacterium]
MYQIIKYNIDKFNINRYFSIVIFLILGGIYIYAQNYFTPNSSGFLTITVFVAVINAYLFFYKILPEYSEKNELSKIRVRTTKELESEIHFIREKYGLLIKEIQEQKNNFWPHQESDYSNMKFELEKIEYDEKISFYRKEMLKEIETLVKNTKLSNKDEFISNQISLH